MQAAYCVQDGVWYLALECRGFDSVIKRQQPFQLLDQTLATVTILSLLTVLPAHPLPARERSLQVALRSADGANAP